MPSAAAKQIRNMIMSDNADKPATPETTPTAPPADKPAAKTDKPPEKRPFKRGGDGGERGPRKRVRDSVPSLDADMLYRQKNTPNVRDLDAEIASELEVAFAGMD